MATKTTQNKRKLMSWLLLCFLLVVVACFLIPTVFSGRGSVRRVQCTGRLASLGCLMLLYADEHRGNFPISKKPDARAHDSFQMLVDAMPDKITPEMFICPATKDVPAQCDENGMFKLKPENVSYAIRKAPLTTGKPPVILACDKSLDNHGGRAGISVLWSDASVKWMPIRELEEEGGFEAFLTKHGLVR